MPDALNSFDISTIAKDEPVLIAGPTASGKSALALRIAESQGGIIVNADALQVFAGWRVLTARPDDADLSIAPHHLYGHVPLEADYSVGHWLRDVTPFLSHAPRPIIVGGTGLYFTALTEGLAEIPATPPEIRAESDARVAAEGFEALLAELDSRSANRLDRQNPMRVQRAWEVLRSTGRGIAEWQDDTPPPLLPLANCKAIALMPDRDWLNHRIEKR
ncbi:MAG: tRNA (adenosine(37)-N6)-dimethylallyltransferase MiaA, partial [Donghicola eburneus]